MDLNRFVYCKISLNLESMHCKFPKLFKLSTLVLIKEQCFLEHILRNLDMWALRKHLLEWYTGMKGP